jgi:hypothetical protein
VRKEKIVDPIAQTYADEPVRYPALQVIDLNAEGAAVTEKYRNMVINRVNDSCVRLAVFDEAYHWHYDLADGRELRLKPLECVTIPAMMRHRTRAVGRTVNLCFERAAAETVFVEAP